MPDQLNQPVKAIDPATNYYGELKLNNGPIGRAVAKAWGNMHANLANESDDHKDTQGDLYKKDREQAMARRMGKVY